MITTGHAAKPFIFLLMAYRMNIWLGIRKIVCR